MTHIEWCIPALHSVKFAGTSGSVHPVTELESLSALLSREGLQVRVTLRAANMAELCSRTNFSVDDVLTSPAVHQRMFLQHLAEAGLPNSACLDHLRCILRQRDL